MTVTVWGWQNGWINVALGSMMVLLPVGTVTGIRRRAIDHLIHEMPDGLLPESIQQRIHNSLLGTTGNLMVALVIGIVFLMTTKPTHDGALISIGTSIILGDTGAALGSLALVISVSSGNFQL